MRTKNYIIQGFDGLEARLRPTRIKYVLGERKNAVESELRVGDLLELYIKEKFINSRGVTTYILGFPDGFDTENYNPETEYKKPNSLNSLTEGKK